MKIDFVKTLTASGPYVPGTIYFEETTSLIKVATETNKYRVFGGVRSAEYDSSANTLTIQNGNGEEIYIDFSQYVNINDFNDRLDDLTEQIPQRFVVDVTTPRHYMGIEDVSLNHYYTDIVTEYDKGNTVEVNDNGLILPLISILRNQNLAEFGTTVNQLSVLLEVHDSSAERIQSRIQMDQIISDLSLSIDSSTYVITLSGTKADGTSFTVSDPIDLPLESVVVNGSYNSSTKKVVLTLKSGSTVEFSVADLISGLQSEITSSNKLSADLIQDGTTNKVVTATDKNKWNNLVSNVQADWNATTGLAVILNKPTIPAAPGTLNTNNTSAQTASASEALSGTINLHKIAKTGTYSDLIGKPTITDEKLKTTSITTSVADASYNIIFSSGESTGTKLIDSNSLFYEIYPSLGSRWYAQVALTIGNSNSGDSRLNRVGYLKLYGSSGKYTQLCPGFGQDVSVYLPATGGTLALTSDIPTDASVAAWGYIKSYTETDPTVPSWAKQTNKPTYTASEVGALPSTTVIPTQTTDASVAAWGYIKSYTESDPTVPDWAKASTKPTYTASEVGALPSTTVIPTQTTDASIAAWGYIKTISDASIAALGYTKNAGTLTGVKFNNTNATINGSIAEITATIPSTLDQIADGSTRKLSDYLPLSGGTMNEGAGITFIDNDLHLYTSEISSQHIHFIDNEDYNDVIIDPTSSYIRFTTNTNNGDNNSLFTSYGHGIIMYKASNTPRVTHVLQLPEKDGTFALTSDIPTDASVSGWGYIKTVTDASIAALGYTKNTGTLTGVKFNNVAATINGTVAEITATIPAAVTESTVSGWGFTKNAGTITGITMNGASKGTSGNVDLGTVIIAETQPDWNVTNTSSAAYIKNKPTIPAAITESTVSGWGFTKNAAANNATITIQKNGTTVDSFTVDASSNKTINMQVNELPAVTASDNGKILRVVNGAWAADTVITVYSGSSEPSSSQGINGDIYIQS